MKRFVWHPLTCPLQISFLPMVVFGLLLTILVVGCQSKEDRVLVLDEWYSIPEDYRSYTEGNVEIYLVDKAALEKALTELERQPFVEISRREAESLTNRQVISDKRCILTRAVYFAFSRDGFKVYQKGDSLWLRHSVLSSSTKTMRYAVVLAVKELPARFFVSCDVAR